ncbi:diguanylate cyclase domain-containing protein [Rhizobium sp. Rhizsp82]|uniref:diguanylate cyclase domain-containing protein n=1 Tax=Rhizobium sp. Rhizsp82 TaxID=3243057 RepID=UPI0039B3E9C3
MAQAFKEFTTPGAFAVHFLDDDFRRNFEERREDIARRFPGGTENQLEHLTLRLELALEALEAGVWEYHPETGVLLWDRRMRELFGVTEAKDGPTFEIFRNSLHHEDLSIVENALSTSLETGRKLSGQFRITRPAGETRHMRVSGMPFQLPDGETIMVGANWDITNDVAVQEDLRASALQVRAQNDRLEAAHFEMERLMLHDALTNLPNRRYLDRFLASPENRGRRAACLQIDLDHFKEVNDTDGHAAGDEVLKLASVRLFNNLPQANILARLGGDEFVAMIVGPDAIKIARSSAAAILAAFGKPLVVNGRAYAIGVSIGIASADDGPSSALLVAADKALYDAKGNGRGRIRER